jgi:putative membrane protein
MTSLLADANHWHDGHWWIAFPVFWLLFAALVATIFFRFGRGPRDRGDSAKRILSERFARGEITGDEYRDRLAQLQ